MSSKALLIFALFYRCDEKMVAVDRHLCLETKSTFNVFVMCLKMTFGIMDSSSIIMTS